ncbi:MAG: CoA pyrophosphatase [Myxococcales bacterium]|nr:CoA pyrophosphatase [Myxococcales bacterium]
MTPTPDQVAAALAEHVRKDMAALPGRHNTLRAGILVPLVWRGELECVLTERCAKLRHHGGEVSFPGGRPEPDDVDLAATAVRETHEEIGVADVRLLGELSSVPLYTSEFRLVPFVAALPDQPMRPAEGEVAAILRFSIRAELERGWSHGIPWEHGDARFVSPVYELEGRIVYGGTAEVLGELVRVLAPLYGRPAPELRPGRYTWPEVLVRE